MIDSLKKTVQEALEQAKKEADNNTGVTHAKYWGMTQAYLHVLNEIKELVTEPKKKNKLSVEQFNTIVEILKEVTE